MLAVGITNHARISTAKHKLPERLIIRQCALGFCLPHFDICMYMSEELHVRREGYSSFYLPKFSAVCTFVRFMV